MMGNKTAFIRTSVPLIIFIIIAVFLQRGLYRDPHRIPSPLIGKPVPEFRAATLKNPNEQITNKILKGQVSLLNVFATWCISCRAEHPILIDIRHSHQVVIYGLNYKDNRQAALKWLQQYGNPYNKIIYDPAGQIGINFGVYGTPETFIIDKKGIIRYKYIGPIAPTEWHDELLPEISRLENNDDDE